MSMYKYVRELYKKPKENLGEVWKSRLIKWRKEPVSQRIEKPTRLDRARSLGYKAKPGIIIVRQRVSRTARKRPERQIGRRRPKTQRRRKIVNKTYQQIAEERAVKKYPNCEVLNSYWVIEDGKSKWYEIILVDTHHPVTKKQMSWMVGKRGRAHRGLTSSAKKSRALKA